MTTPPHVPFLMKPAFRAFCVAFAGMTALPAFCQAMVDLADQPLSTSATVPGNLLLALSVEFPTAISASYKASTTPYTTASTYLGYFDPEKCYRYNYNNGTPGDSYFEPQIMASSHACASTVIRPLWSGNWLNWASMQTIDSFRSALTGGYRAVDTASDTILEKAWGAQQGSQTSNAPAKRLPASGNSAALVNGATPFNFGNVTSTIWGLGNRLRITATGNLSASNPIAYVTQSAQSLPQAKTNDVYEVVVRVQVCNPTLGVESNCKKYGDNFKPEGLLQKYATRIRYGAFGYLNDGNINRDGGVLRASMKFVGPTKAIPGRPVAANGATEWSSIDGRFITNPDSADATASNVNNSGVLNYLNKFGQAAGSYKTYDPISEMYYGAVRYFKNLGNVAAYSDLGTNAANATVYKDGFPVITNWVDPILYSCQKNFILGIGDTNTHRDANLPGSGIRSSEPTMPTEVAADTTVDVKAATDMVGTLEGINNFGSSFVSNSATYFIAGLAYDSHTRDMRPNDFKNAGGGKTNIQTITTFWLDVLESGYRAKNNNAFYMATKYGGFKVPADFKPYAASNALNTLTIGTGTTPLTDAMWHTGSDTIGGDKRPDNYYDASAADDMIRGLETAFQNIASQLQEATTAFSATSARATTSGNASYQSKYDAASWSGDVIANSTIFDAAGNPTFTNVWNTKTLLETQSTRNIVTCCTASNAGLPFRVANLSAGGLNTRVNYASFALVPGVALASQSAEKYLEYLRGNRANEQSKLNGVYRTRPFLLGDIVNSKITAIGAPEAILADSTNPGYAAYRIANSARKSIVYVGANDGMLHAFDGSLGAGGGKELFAYIPSFTYGTVISGPVSGLASLGSPNFVHHYMVDQTPSAHDIDLARTDSVTNATPNWRSVLIGGMGKGGKGYYALDITSPESWTSEVEIAKKVLWEFTDPSMGFSFGDAVVLKTRKYGWVVVLTSGYNNADGMGYFYIVNPANGALLEKISTGFGSVSMQAGLTYASGYTTDFSDGIADAVYAGDLHGNVWRLNLTAASGNYPAPVKIAELRDAAGNSQPVTTRPLIEIQPNTKKRYVLIGTGRLLDNSDISSSQVQSFYAIGDGSVDAFYTAATLPAGRTFPLRRGDLNVNANLLTGIGAAPSNPLGWYHDLGMSSNGAAERVTINPTANFGVVAFAANLPNGDACNPAGTNRVFGLNFGTGQSILTDAAGTKIGFSTKLAGVVTDIGFINLNGKIKLSAGNNQLQVTNIEGPGDASSNIKRLNWRELPTAD